MNKTAKVLIILILSLAGILIVLGLVLVNPKGIFKKSTDKKSDLNPQIESLLKADKYNEMTNTGVRSNIGDSKIIEIAGTIKRIEKDTLVIGTLNKEYKLQVTEDMKVLLIDEKLSGQAQLDKLATQDLSDLKIGEQLTASCVIGEGNVLSVVGLRKNIR